MSSPALSPEDVQHLRAAIEVSRLARQHGNHPFGATLVNEHGNLLLKGENTVLTENDVTGHAETNLVRAAAQKYSPEQLRRCTLYASTEPCPMCAGAIFWSQIGRVVFALSSGGLYARMGGSVELKLPTSREILGPVGVEVLGPFLEEEAGQAHAGFWK